MASSSHDYDFQEARKILLDTAISTIKAISKEPAKNLSKESMEGAVSELALSLVTEGAAAFLDVLLSRVAGNVLRALLNITDKTAELGARVHHLEKSHALITEAPFETGLQIADEALTAIERNRKNSSLVSPEVEEAKLRLTNAITLFDLAWKHTNDHVEYWERKPYILIQKATCARHTKGGLSYYGPHLVEQTEQLIVELANESQRLDNLKTQKIIEKLQKAVVKERPQVQGFLLAAIFLRAADKRAYELVNLIMDNENAEAISSTIKGLSKDVRPFAEELRAWRLNSEFNESGKLAVLFWQFSQALRHDFSLASQ